MIILKETEDYQIIAKRMPHISSALSLLWGSQEFYIYVRHLMLDTRDGNREGFPKEIAKAILNLIKIHEVESPEHQSKDIWSLL